MTNSKFSNTRVFSRSLFKVIESQILTKKRWTELLKDSETEEIKLKPLFVIGDVVVMKSEKFLHGTVIMNATNIDLLIDAIHKGKNINPILSGAVFKKEHSLIFIINCWKRSDDRERAKIEKQFSVFIKTWNNEEKKQAVKWVTASINKGEAKNFFLRILRSKKNGKS